MMEHLHWDISAAALGYTAEALEEFLGHVDNAERTIKRDVYQELENLMNECRARVQHAAIGMPDLSPPHAHSVDCWEPDSGCDMGRNEEYARTATPPVTEEDWLS